MATKKPKSKPGAGEVDAMVCLGVVTGAHGLKGAVKVKSFTAHAEDVAAYGPVRDDSGEREFDIAVTGAAKDRIIVALSGVTDRDAADALRGTRLYVTRAALPPPDEDEFYHADLVGLAAEDTGGRPVGTVKALFDFGAGDVIEIEGTDGKPIVLPFTRAAVPVVDIAGGRIVVDPPPGLTGPFDKEAERAALEELENTSEDETE